MSTINGMYWPERVSGMANTALKVSGARPKDPDARDKTKVF